MEDRTAATEHNSFQENFTLPKLMYMSFAPHGAVDHQKQNHKKSQNTRNGRQLF